jgi:3-oxoacyl-[acyl-carrier-protein] synthase II
MDQQLSHRVVVTVMGLISPVGLGTNETWQALLKGHSGIAPITLFDAGSLDCQIAGEVKGFIPGDGIDRKDLKKTGRFIQMAIAATDTAIRDSGLQIDLTNAAPIEEPPM